MPGSHCVLYGCSSSGRYKVSIFKIPSLRKDESEYTTALKLKARKEWINVISQNRTLTPELKTRIENNKVSICELHFKPDCILENPTRKDLVTGSVPTENLVFTHSRTKHLQLLKLPVRTLPCQTKKRKLEEDFSKESPKNENLHHNVICKDTRMTAVSHDENIVPEQRNSPSPEMTKSRRKAPRSHVRKVVRTNSQCNVAETNAASQVVQSETTSNESVTKPTCLEKTTSNESIKEPESYEKQVDVVQDMNNTTSCSVLVSSRNESITIPPVGEHGCGAVNETMVTEEDYQRKYFQLLNTMNDLQDKFLVSQRNFEDFVRAREAFIEELKSTLDDKHREIDSVKRELEKSNDTILELEETRKMYEEKIQNLNQKVEDVKRKEAEVKQHVLKDKEEQLQQLIEKQQEVLEFYKLLTSVTVEKVVEDQNSSTVYDKFRCSVKTAQTKELEFMLSYDPEFAEVEYTPLALDSQSVDSSFPEYLKEQIFFESDQAPNFLRRLIQTFQKPDK